MAGPRGQSTLFVLMSLQGLENICLPNIFFHLHVNCLLSLSSTKQLLPTSSFVFKMVFKVRVLFISVNYSVFLVLYHVAFLPGEFQGKRSLVNNSPRSQTRLDNKHTHCVHILLNFSSIFSICLLSM